MKSKPYNYSSKNRSKQPYKKRKNNYKDFSKEKNKKSNLEENEVKIEDNRFDDSDFLDTSFFGARVEDNKKSKENKKPIIDTSELLKKVDLIRKSFLYLACFLAVLLVGLFIYNNLDVLKSIKLKNSSSSQERKEEVSVVKKNSKIDDNYLFVGDFHSANFSFGDYGLDYHFLKSSRSDFVSDDIVNGGKNLIYIYNPSVVFLQVGFNDIERGYDDDTIILNLSKIIEGIKNNRPNATIFVESIYPIDSSRIDFENATSDRIINLNERYKKLSKELDVNYFDVYNMLVKGNVIDSKYSDNGLNLNQAGYEQVINGIKKVLG